MLDLETRKRIDNARDILVGKVPDPKSQVEQITIALIYKFMDDMDKEAEELGGRATFFKGEFAKYSWSNIFDPKLGGYELINLYGEAITRMNQNKNIPQLFRDIFKNAFLPYRDPETLKSFLKEINDFHYDHSERLGDAFEYLLSVLGVQGDAGSLRTPRHIIDFIVKVIAPKKNETILDPACGTAGFLISAYKYIRDQNTDKRKGNQLTPDDRKRLMNSIVGHDISPDMVRLSLVNMYLHGFQNPKIYEYDTLTSDERWNETYDIILANPPFMTPKGGIRPHKRFSIQANRSEVLFVDYIMEHIATDGRAGVIVPEGIIFQSANAYKALRKALVENGYLYAVVSLPAGVFNPYSGVKTSILLMDRTLAKKAKDILFLKIENDGFDLGAQRREIDKSDLTEALKIIQIYQECIRKGKEFNVGAINELPLQKLFHIVPKTQIAEGGDYSLTGDRYRERIVHSHKDWPMVALGEHFYKVNDPINPNQNNGAIEYIGLENLKSNTGCLIGKTQAEISDIKSMKTVFKKSDILFGKLRPILNKVWLADRSGICSTDILVLRSKKENVVPDFYVYVMRSVNFNSQVLKGIKGAQLPRVSFDYLKILKIPLPPLSVQQEMVAEIEGYQKIIDGAKQVVANYKPQIKIDPAWPEISLVDVCRFIDYRGKTPEKTNNGIPLITAKNVREGYIALEPQEFIAETDYKTWMRRGIPQVGDVLFTTEAPLGNVAEITSLNRFALAQRLIAFCPDRKLLIGSFLKDILLTKHMRDRIFAYQSGTTVYGIKASVLKEIKIPLPPLKIQKQIVAQIEEEQKLVEANRKLIEIFEEKIKAKIAEVWGEEALLETGGEILMAAEELATYGEYRMGKELEGDE